MKTIILLTAFMLFQSCGKDSPEPESVNKETTSPKAQSAPQLTSDDLRAASLNGDLDTVKEAVEQGVDLHQGDQAGRTALMFASYNGHTEIVRFLKEQGGRIDEANSEGRTPLMFASSGPFPETVEFLLNEGADPNTSDSVENWSPLMYAAAEGNYEVVQILLEHEANVSMEDDDGETALDFARNNGHSEVVKLLEDHL